MSFFGKKAATNNALTGGGDCSMFGVTRDQLNELMKSYDEDLMEKLQSSEYNGVEGILEKLKVNRDQGLDSNNQQDLQQRRIAYGKNEIPLKPISFWQLPWNYMKQRQHRRLQKESVKEQRVTVLRNGCMQEIPANELVVGDLCSIKTDDTIPADGLIVQATDLKIDPSSMTGSSDFMTKDETTDVGLLSSAQVHQGSAIMVVTAVGLNTRIGFLSSLLGAT